jgi:Xaa-Pro aminopeptidase
VATAKANLGGLIVTPGYDLRYLLGSRAQTYERLTALVIPVAHPPTVVVPRLELASLKDSAVSELGLAVRDWVDGEDPYRVVVQALGGPPVATAVTDSMPALHLLPLAKKLGVTPVLATDVLRRLRMIKDDAEVDALRKAGAAIARRARDADTLVTTIGQGRSGADLRAAVDELAGFTGSTWTASELHLVRSHLGAGPERTSRYEPLASWPLRGS